MDTTVNQLNVLLRQGVISAQIYADGIDAIASRLERPTPAPVSTKGRNEAPTPAPVSTKCRNNTPTPAPRRRNGTLQRRSRDLVFRRRQWAIGNFLRCWQMDVPQGHPLGADPLSFLEGVRPQIRQKLTEEILALKGIKFQLAVNIHLRKTRPDGSEESRCVTIRRKQEALLHVSEKQENQEINEVLDKAFPHILEILEKSTQSGSGWMVDHIDTLWLDIARYQPLRGGSYIPLPAAVKNKQAVINVKNTDDRCLGWAILAAKFKVAKNPQRPTKYPMKGALTSQESTPPHRSHRFPRLKSRTIWRSTSLDGMARV